MKGPLSLRFKAWVSRLNFQGLGFKAWNFQGLGFLGLWTSGLAMTCRDIDEELRVGSGIRYDIDYGV
jgi:hypothetical protein